MFKINYSFILNMDLIFMRRISIDHKRSINKQIENARDFHSGDFLV
jgi:hypothetical protein